MKVIIDKDERYPWYSVFPAESYHKDSAFWAPRLFEITEAEFKFLKHLDEIDEIRTNFILMLKERGPCTAPKAD